MVKQVEEYKICTRCKILKQDIHFSPSKTTKDGLVYQCKSCCRESNKNWYYSGGKETRVQYANSPEGVVARRKAKLKCIYDITLEQFELMMQDQNYCCALCSKDLKQLQPRQIHIDHNHITKKVRGILCEQCNKLLGFAKADTDINLLKLAIIYIENSYAQPNHL